MSKIPALLLKIEFDRLLDAQARLSVVIQPTDGFWTSIFSSILLRVHRCPEICLPQKRSKNHLKIIELKSIHPLRRTEQSRTVCCMALDFSCVYVFVPRYRSRQRFVLCLYSSRFILVFSRSKRFFMVLCLGNTNPLQIAIDSLAWPLCSYLLLHWCEMGACALGQWPLQRDQNRVGEIGFHYYFCLKTHEKRLEPLYI